MSITKTGGLAIKPLLKSSLPYVGIGAGVGAVQGAYDALGVKTTADDRVTHWQARLAEAASDDEKAFAREKLDHWKKIRSNIKRRNVTGQALHNATRGAIGGALSFGALNAVNSPRFQSFMGGKG